MNTGEPEAEVTAVVPTIGRSPWLAECLRALRAQEGVRALEIVVVDQAPAPLSLPPALADRVLRPERNLGFAGGTNLGIAATAGSPLVATVNDDALVGAGWLATLAAALRANPGAAAVQGMNLIGDPANRGAAPAEGGGGGGGDDALVDGCGLAWNRWWQAIQLGHGEAAPAAVADRGRPEPGAPTSNECRDWRQSEPRPPAVFEVFGVSATAALFRRAALERVARGGGQVFDPRLITYYEDADLAGRLRAAGFSALLAPAARVLHAGSASAGVAGGRRWRLMYGNRYLAAARLLGRGFWPRLPWMMLRDGLDLVHLLHARGGAARLEGMAAGWARAVRHLPAFAHRGPPAPPPSEVARLSRLSRLAWHSQARQPAPPAAAVPQRPGQPG